jgi:hypothetical protein
MNDGLLEELAGVALTPLRFVRCTPASVDSHLDGSRCDHGFINGDSCLLKAFFARHTRDQTMRGLRGC